MNPNAIRKWAARTARALFFVAIGVLLSFGAIALWLVAVPDTNDPKNLYYALWKHGLNPNMNLDYALDTMVLDGDQRALVIGSTKEQLKSRYGVVRSLNEVSPYYQQCNEIHSSGQPNPTRKSREAVFLRDSNWMVILEHGKAVELVLCKGY
jgi:hypothetical protein